MTLDDLRRDITRAVDQTLVALRRKHAKKKLLGFALCTDDDASTLFPMATFQSQAKELGELEFDFNPNEWELDGHGLARSSWNAISSALQDEVGTSKQRFRAFVDALAAVRDRGGFGKAAERRDLVLRVISTDASDELERLHDEWLKELSSPEVWKRHRALVRELENPRPRPPRPVARAPGPLGAPARADRPETAGPVADLLREIDATTRDYFARTVVHWHPNPHRQAFGRLKKAPAWFGEPGASEATIARLEKRLRATLPPSYRAFLAASNGWRHYRTLLPAEKVAWFSRREQDRWADLFWPDDEPRKKEFRPERLDGLLLIGGNDVYGPLLLDPEAKGKAGEWGVLHLDCRHFEVTKRRSFHVHLQEWLEDVRISIEVL